MLDISNSLTATKKRLVPKPNTQSSADVVMTPPELADRLVAHLNPSGRLLDPCRGDGAFYNAMKRYSPTVDWFEISEGRDFLDPNQELEEYDWVITGPPFSSPTFPMILETSMVVAHNVAFLTTVTTVVTRSRLNMMYKMGFGLKEMVLLPRPTTWPSSGFMTALVHYQHGYTGPTNMTNWNAVVEDNY